MKYRCSRGEARAEGGAAGGASEGVTIGVLAAGDPLVEGPPTGNEQLRRCGDHEGLLHGMAEAVPRREGLHDLRVVPGNEDRRGGQVKQDTRSKKEPMNFGLNGTQPARQAGRTGD